MKETDSITKILQFAETIPNKPALVDEQAQLTYMELAEAIDQTVRLLQEHQLQREIVILQIPRGIHFPVLVLALTKEKIPFIPQDIMQPKERLDELIRLSGAQTIISLHNDKYTFSKVCNGEKTTSDAWAIYFTSGSTGTPKAVEIPRQNIENTVVWQREEYQLTAQDRAAAFTPYSFVVSYMDIFPILCVGGTLYILSEELRHDLSALEAYLRRHQITFMNATTVVGEIMIRTMRLPDMRLLTLAGQRFPAMELSRIAYRVINVYGNTECGAATINHVDPLSAEVGIGLPVKNMSALILGEKRQVLADGEVGELFISGVQVAEGYFQNEEATNEAFITVRHKGVELKGYRTGDFAHIQQDGTIFYHGRRDRQYKINGVRIDLAEIERAFRRVVPDLDQLHIAVRNEQISCWFTGEQVVDEKTIIQELAASLPEVMVPKRIRQLSEFPVNGNGKIDEAELFQRIEREKEEFRDDPCVQADTEHYLTEVWAELLGISPKSIHPDSDFKELGATSLQIMELGVKILQDLKKKLNFVDLHYHSKLREMAEFLEQRNHFQPIYTFVGRDETMGDNPPLFVIHSGNTGSDVYRPLFSNIHPPKFPIYIIEPHNLLSPGERIKGVEKLAAYYIELIENFAPEKEQTDFHLMGWSYGGVIATEMCHQLENRRSEKDVCELMVIDSPLYLKQADLDQLREREATGYYTKYFEETHIFKGMNERNITTERLIENNHQVFLDLYEYEVKPVSVPVIFIRSLAEDHPLTDDQIQAVFHEAAIKDVYAGHDYLFVEKETCVFIQKELKLIPLGADSV